MTRRWMLRSFGALSLLALMGVGADASWIKTKATDCSCCGAACVCTPCCGTAKAVKAKSSCCSAKTEKVAKSSCSCCGDSCSCATCCETAVKAPSAG